MYFSKNFTKANVGDFLLKQVSAAKLRWNNFKIKIARKEFTSKCHVLVVSTTNTLSLWVQPHKMKMALTLNFSLHSHVNTDYQKILSLSSVRIVKSIACSVHTSYKGSYHFLTGFHSIPEYMFLELRHKSIKNIIFYYCNF